MTNKNGQKDFLNKLYSLRGGGILKILIGNFSEIQAENFKKRGYEKPAIRKVIKELYIELLGKSNLESKTEDFKQNSFASLKKPYNSYNHLDDFRNHETFNPSKIAQKNNSLQKKIPLLLYSSNFVV